MFRDAESWFDLPAIDQMYTHTSKALDISTQSLTSPNFPLTSIPSILDAKC